MGSGAIIYVTNFCKDSFRHSEVNRKGHTDSMVISWDYFRLLQSKESRQINSKKFLEELIAHIFVIVILIYNTTSRKRTFVCTRNEIYSYKAI
jgi:hypothetical protein